MMTSEAVEKAKQIFSALRKSHSVIESMALMKDHDLGVFAVVRAVSSVEGLTVREVREIFDTFPDWERF